MKCVRGGASVGKKRCRSIMTSPKRMSRTRSSDPFAQLESHRGLIPSLCCRTAWRKAPTGGSGGALRRVGWGWRRLELCILHRLPLSPEIAALSARIPSRTTARTLRRSNGRIGKLRVNRRRLPRIRSCPMGASFAQALRSAASPLAIIRRKAAKIQRKCLGIEPTAKPRRKRPSARNAAQIRAHSPALAPSYAAARQPARSCGPGWATRPTSNAAGSEE